MRARGYLLRHHVAALIEAERSVDESLRRRDSAIAAARAAGVSWRSIGAALGISYSSVYRRWSWVEDE